MPGRAPQRIVVIGSSNAGKTTLAERLARVMDAPLIELDALHWESGWRMADTSVFRDRVRAATEPDRWVMAGNYLAKQQEVSWPRADTIVWLDLSLATLLRRCVRRSWRRWRSQERLYGGDNRERFVEHLMLWDTDRSLIAHITRTHRRRRRDYEVMSHDSQWAHLTFIRLRTTDEIEDWLRGFQ